MSLHAVCIVWLMIRFSFNLLSGLPEHTVVLVPLRLFLTPSSPPTTSITALPPPPPLSRHRPTAQSPVAAASSSSSLNPSSSSALSSTSSETATLAFPYSVGVSAAATSATAEHQESQLLAVAANVNYSNNNNNLIEISATSRAAPTEETLIHGSTTLSRMTAKTVHTKRIPIVHNKHGAHCKNYTPPLFLSYSSS